jgi:hypothetical protein
MITGINKIGVIPVVKKKKNTLLAWPKRPKIICSPSYADIRSRANTTRGLDFEHMIKQKHTREG